MLVQAIADVIIGSVVFITGKHKYCTLHMLYVCTLHVIESLVYEGQLTEHQYEVLYLESTLFHFICAYTHWFNRYSQGYI